MIDKVLSLARPAILELKSYVSARSLATEAKVFLDANENPKAPYPEDSLALNRYPEPQSRDLKQVLASFYSVSAEEILLGRGSGEAIDLFIRAFCESSKDSILICPPSFGLYKTYADIQGASVISVPLKKKADSFDFSLDVDGVLEAWNPSVKLIFICSPNNPTGTLFPREDIVRILDSLQSKVLVVIDEAYIEFSSVKESFASLISKYPNLVVLRTLSKAWALAGARCGVAMAQAPLISLVRKLQAPYPLTSSTIQDSLRVIESQRETFDETMARVICDRREFEAELRQLSCVLDVAPSEANFLLVQFKNSEEIMAACRARGFLLRSMAHDPLLPNCIRISLGLKTEMTELMTLLRSLEGDLLNI